MKKVMQEIHTRFFHGIPPSENKPARLMVNVQEAYWFFLDFLQPTYKVQTMDLKTFTEMLCSHNIISIGENSVKQIMNMHKEYTANIPRAGAIILNTSMDKVVMIQHYQGRKYSFPGGKKNQHESESACAIREVYEEIGLDISGRLDEANFMELSDGPVYTKFFIIAGVDENVSFQTQTRCEIRRIEWVKISDIPSKKRKKNEIYRYNQFWRVHQVLQQLKKWIETKRFKPREEVEKQELMQMVEFRINRHRVQFCMQRYGVPEAVAYKCIK